MSEALRSVQGEGVPVPRGPYSPAVVRGDLVSVSGRLAVKPDCVAVSGDIREEAMIVLRNLEKVLAVTVYLGDIGDLAAFKEAYGEFFKPPYPSRSALDVSLRKPFQV